MTITTESIGFIGLGELGLPIATNLFDAGYDLKIFNRTASKAASLVTRGAHQVDHPTKAVTTGGIVATLVWDDVALESIVRSEEFLEKLGLDGIHISMTTISPETSKRLAEAHSHYGSFYIDAPVLGRPQAAVARHLVIPFSGKEEAKVRARPLLQAMGARSIFDFGEDVGSANIVKLIANFLVASAGYSLSEAVRVAQANKVDPKIVVEMLTNSLFAAPIYQNLGRLVTETERADPFSGAKILVKDLGLFRRAAKTERTPVAQLISDLLSEP